MTQSSTLRERAAAAANVNTPPTQGLNEPDPAVFEPGLPDIEYTDPIATVEAVPVHVAWNRVMADVRSVDKGDRFEGGNAGRFNYRGADRILNAVGPALRRHGVAIIPVKTVPEYRDITTSKGSKMRECTVTVDYVIIGPDGSKLPAQSIGEAVDTSDKGTTKATTIAYRNLLITALTIPLENKELDAEAQHIERGERPRPRPGAYVEEICHPRTSLGRLQQIRREINQHELGGALIQNEHGDEEKLGDLLARHGKAKQEAAAAEAGA